MADRSSRAGAARTWRNMAGARRSGLSEATIDALIAASLPPGESSRLADRVERLPDPAGALRALQGFRAETGRLPDPSRLPNFLATAGFSPYRTSLDTRYGRPTCRDDQGHLDEATFVVVALGKLGGEELNYSSDIDLLYLFSRDGETSRRDLSGEGSTSNREFFTRLATEITRLIAGTGPEGQVFRIDLGLRPGGKDGDITVSLQAALAYYRNWAEGWERQALIKARPAAGSVATGRRFVEGVEPLVYPARPDPYMILEIGAMKDRIDARLSSVGRSDTDIKLGRGGIRELEFGVQALQLQHGGKDPWLREGNTLLALHRLADKGFIGYEEYSDLSGAYVFLRELEHRLQLGQNRQTATLPGSASQLLVVARRIGLHEQAQGRELEALLETLDRHREVVRRFYDSVTGTVAQARPEDGQEDLWLDR